MQRVVVTESDTFTPSSTRNYLVICKGAGGGGSIKGGGGGAMAADVLLLDSSTTYDRIVGAGGAADLGGAGGDGQDSHFAVSGGGSTLTLADYGRGATVTPGAGGQIAGCQGIAVLAGGFGDDGGGSCAGLYAAGNDASGSAGGAAVDSDSGAGGSVGNDGQSPGGGGGGGAPTTAGSGKRGQLEMALMIQGLALSADGLTLTVSFAQGVIPNNEMWDGIDDSNLMTYPSNWQYILDNSANGFGEGNPVSMSFNAMTRRLSMLFGSPLSFTDSNTSGIFFSQGGCYGQMTVASLINGDCSAGDESVYGLLNCGAAPSVSNSTITPTSIALSISAVGGADGHRIYSHLDGYTTPIYDGASGFEVTAHTGLTPGTAYHYKGKAYNDAGETVFSSVLDVVTTISTPTGFAAGTPTSTTIPLSWNAVAGAVSYKLYTSADGYTTGTDLGNVTSYTPTGLTPSTTYNYKLTAVGSDAESAKTGVVSATTAAASSSVSSGGGSAWPSARPFALAAFPVTRFPLT